MFSFLKKHAVLSAVLLISIYCAGTILVSSLQGLIPGLMYLASVSAVLTVLAVRGGLAFESGFLWPENCRRYLYFIPLWIITTSGLWGGLKPECEGVLLTVSVISMLGVGYIEEVLFRGFLFTSLLKKCGVVVAVIVSSVSFGLAHIVNLFAGQATLMTLVQIVYAFAWGFIYTMVFYRSGSILPCIISHILFDMAGYFNNEGQLLSWIAAGAVVVVSVVYGTYLARLPAEAAAPADAGRAAKADASAEAAAPAAPGSRTGHLYIMRHGITDWNVIHKLQGQSDIPLNEDGRALARKAHDEYLGVHFDACFCSPLLRAKETAALLLEGRDVPVLYDDRLKEMCFGEYEGIENSFAIPDCPINAFFQDPAHYEAPGSAETMNALFERTGAFLEERVKPLLAEGKDVLIVGHGAMNASIVCQVRHLPLEQFWANGLEQCKLVELEENA